MTGAPEWGRYAGVITRLEAGETLASACRAENLSYDTTYRYLRKRGIAVGQNNLKMPAAGTFVILADLINTDKPMSIIAAERGRSAQRISWLYQKAKDAGIPVQPRGRVAVSEEECLG
jgi:hypothetical protein